MSVFKRYRERQRERERERERGREREREMNKKETEKEGEASVASGSNLFKNQQFDNLRISQKKKNDTGPKYGRFVCLCYTKYYQE